MLEGVARWNRDREVAAVTDANSALTYDSALTSAVNKLSENVLGKKLFGNFRGPNKYTGNCKIFHLFFYCEIPNNIHIPGLVIGIYKRKGVLKVKVSYLY